MIILGIHGRAGAGKTTAAQILQDDFGFHVVPFAGPLKRMAREFGLTAADMSEEGKEAAFRRPLPYLDERLAQKMLIAMGVPLTDLCLTPDKPLHYLGGKAARQARASLVEWALLYRDQWTTPRRFLQLIGTEWGRGMVAPGLWLNMWDMDCREVREDFGDRSPIVADDVRFDNEAQHIRERSGRVLQLEREAAGSVSGSGHASEKGISPELVDITIQNDGDHGVLRARMGGILDRYFADEAI